MPVLKTTSPLIPDGEVGAPNDRPERASEPSSRYNCATSPLLSRALSAAAEDDDDDVDIVLLLDVDLSRRGTVLIWPLIRFRMIKK
jgi:hypothetical protein